MIIIEDNFLTSDEVSFLQTGYINIDLCWFDLKFEELENYEHIVIKKMLKFSSKFFNLNDMVGIETWAQVNTRPGNHDSSWHYDKDEFLFKKYNKLSYPLMTCIYYLSVKNLKGGNLLTENEIIKPIENRLVCFSPGVYHSVEPFNSFTGERISLLLNPWNYKINYE